ncbi:MAG TPA: GNAT family protein [Candidatus Saccharimonadales bacterium]|nr:GNAT family protein [Candidatus Saccharimonadales bacterium]
MDESPTDESPLGEPLDWSPPPAPIASVALEGATVRLEPVDPDRHAAALFAAAQGPGADPRLWNYMSYGPFADLAEFQAWLRAGPAASDPLFYAIVDRTTSGARGMASYLRISPPHGVIEIGHIWFGAGLQRTRQATEAIYLLGRHAFDEFGYRRLEWKCDALNARSRRAAERFGFTFEGIFRQHVVVKGRNRDTAWFAILDRDWPRIRVAFETWLAPANLDATGQQRRSLAEIRADLERSNSWPAPARRGAAGASRGG